MERAEQAMVERVINHEMQERFSAGAVQRAVLLQHGDDPAIEPGQLLVRVFVEGVGDEPGLTAWQSAHQGGIDAIRRELSLRLPAARLLEFTIDSPGDQPGAPRISVPDDGSLAAEQLSGREIVTKALELLRANYVFPEQAGRAATAIEARLEAGEYDDLDEITLTERLTRHLQEITGDRHLRVALAAVQVRPSRADPGANPRSRKDHEARRLAMRRMRAALDNFGIRQVERLDGNVGYLDVRRVAVPANAGPAIGAAMELVAGTYALIIDLRHNGGGAPEGVVFWCSYLLDERPTHLNDIFHADTGETRQFWALPYVPGTRYLGPPGLRADQRPHVLRGRGFRLHAAGSGPGHGGRRDDRRRRAPDPGLPDQRRGAHRHSVRALGQPGDRHELAGHRGGAGRARGRGAGLRRGVRPGPGGGADHGRRAAADRGRRARGARRAAGCGVTRSPSRLTGPG